MTIYTALMLIMVMSLILAILESARIYVARKNISIYSNLSVESLFSNYQGHLYDKYGIFGVEYTGDETFSVNSAEQIVLGNMERASSINKNHSLIKMTADKAEIVKYELLTDDYGGPFIKQLKESLTTDAVKTAIKYLKQKNELIEMNTGEEKADMETIKTATSYIEEAEAVKKALEEKNDTNDIEESGDKGRKSAYKKASPVTKQDEASDEGISEAIKQMSLWDEDAILAMLLPNAADVSNTAVEKEKRLINRKRNEGNYTGQSEFGISEKLLLTYFCNEKLNSYCDKNSSDEDNASLDYEMEYVCFGKMSDKENLKDALFYMLGMREAVNLVYIMSSAEKKEEAMAQALVITTLLAAPEAASAVQLGILTAWATAESILEVRSLASGKRLPIIKNDSNWNLGLNNLLDGLSGLGEVKEDSNGLAYEDYLNSRLILMNLKDTAVRTLDVMEMGLNEDGYMNIRADEMITAVECKCSFNITGVFTEIMPWAIGRDKDWTMFDDVKFKYY